VFGLEKRPLWISAVVGGVLALAVYAALFWQITTKQRARLEAQNRRLAELQVKIQEGRAAEQKLPEFRDEVRRLSLDLDKLLRILPPRRNTPDLLRRIRSLTEQGDFDLRVFTPGGFIDRDFYSEWPITIDLGATYHNLAHFFDRISRFSRIINVENLQVGALRNNPRHSISASFVAKTFVYKEPPPPEPAPAAGGSP
jgi:Tfp pilus assembly protein PilO